tara:strand:- start:506 stop:673 length:168 start_codon:yes stop_codon:yes gene_type:complete
MKLRIKELAEALEAETADVLAICAILKLPATSSISSLNIEDAKKITDYYSHKLNR